MKLVLIRPTGKQLFDIAWLELNTPAGNMIIQQDHAPMIVTLTPQKPFTFMARSGKQESVTIHRAVAEITRLSVTIVLNEGA